MDRSDDAKKRLTALHQPIPRPTKGAVAQNRAELESRSESTTVQKLMGLVKKGPDMSSASKVGEPSLADPEPVAATSVVRSETFAAAGVSEKSVGVEIVKPASTSPGCGDNSGRCDSRGRFAFWPGCRRKHATSRARSQ